MRLETARGESLSTAGLWTNASARARVCSIANTVEKRLADYSS